ncbi:hypothetical protein TNCV_4754641 [Trichonephila clavipes]|nr:hypothetical protein TNCV_4754641 [Trichonephila clavipes]
MSVLSQPAYFAHANVFHHEGKPVPIELSIATIPRDGSDPEVMCITVNHAGQPSKPKDVRSNCQENARLRLVHHPLPKSVPVEYLPFCVRRKFNQLARGSRGLMVIKGLEQQKNFQELGLYAMTLENLPKFKDICDGTCSVSSLHQEAHCAPLRIRLSVGKTATLYILPQRITLAQPAGSRTPEGVKTSKGTTRKEELILIADELGEKTTPEMKVLDLKNLILNSEKYKNNKEFMDDYLDSIISNRISYEEQARADRKSKEEQARLTAESQLEFERINLEKVKLEIELGK